jgi:drug/metabolite transporter (DMT)-like permease
MSTAPATGRTPQASNTAGHRLGLFAAFFAIYILWGTTFLGIRVAVLEMPPIFAAAARFFTAGAILFTFLRVRGQQGPTRMEWRNLFLIAVLMFVLEYAGLFWGERYIPSGISSVLAATIPLFTLIAEVAVVREQRWNAVIGVATALGFAGVVVLMLPASTNGGAVAVPLWPALAILGGSSGWALGSVLSRSLKLPGSRLMTSACTMMLGGAVLFGVSALCGELNPLPHLTTRGLIALVYLIVVGSLIAFPSYVWLLSQMPATRVASYAYVNPIVAVILGYFLAGEAITLRTMAGGALVLISVFLILRARR